jgi:tripartite-type tricarboxylate transporter receptor subunit TctC
VHVRNAAKGFAPITQLAQAPEAIMVHPSVPAKSVKDLVDLLTASPGKYSYGSPGFGTTPHLAGERLFKVTNRLDVAHVPFTGAAGAVNAVLGSHAQILFITIGAVADHVRNGTLRLLAVASPKRWPAFPDVPTMTEAGYPDHDAEFIMGVLAPAKTPSSIVDRLNAEIVKVLAQQDVKQGIEALGLQPIGNTPSEFATKLERTTQTWSKVVSAAGIKTH